MRFTPFRNFLLLWLQLGIEKFRLKTMKRQSDFTIWKISRDVVQRCSIRQRNAKKEIVWVFQDLVFKESLAAMDPRIRSSSDQKIVKLGASWFPSLIKRKRKPVRQSGFQGAAPDGHKFVLLLFQHLRHSRVDVEINEKDIQRHKLPSCGSIWEGTMTTMTTTMTTMLSSPLFPSHPLWKESRRCEESPRFC